MRWLAILLLVLAACQERKIEAVPPPPPEVAYAWVIFGADGVSGSGSAGLADRARGRRLGIDDPVRIASVSKLVVALGVMRLVEQGRLDLDEDVSEKLGWRLRNPAHAGTPITLRLLLSHRSSLKDDVDYIVPLGRTLESAFLDPAAFDGQHAPGTYFRYSNLNFPVVATVMEQATGERFDRLIDRLVLKPLGLDACFNWSTCSDRVIARAVVLYETDGTVVRDDLGGKRPACPVVSASEACDLEAYRPGTNGALFSPQGGLRISARDLATVGRLLLNRGRHGGRAFLRPESIAAMTAPAWRYDGANGDTTDGFYCGYGLGVQILPTAADGCRDDLFEDGRRAVGHAGDAYRVRSGLWIDTERKVGIAFFATNNSVDPPRGRSAYRAVEEWLAAKIRD